MVYLIMLRFFFYLNLGFPNFLVRQRVKVEYWEGQILSILAQSLLEIAKTRYGSGVPRNIWVRFIKQELGIRV